MRDVICGLLYNIVSGVIIESLTYLCVYIYMYMQVAVTFLTCFLSLHGGRQNIFLSLVAYCVLGTVSDGNS